MISCPGDKSVTNDNPDILSSRPQYSNNLTQNDLKSRLCSRNRNGFYPNFRPLILNLSTNTSLHGAYSLVYVTGLNYQPPCIATTYVKFFNSIFSYDKLPITFYSTSSLSFVVPSEAPTGTYSVVAVNVYNGNFSPQVNSVYPGTLNYSNIVKYIVT